MPQRAITNPRLGALIRAERRRAGLSLRGLAERCGVHYSALNKIELGQVASPDPTKLRAIAIALRIDVQDLYVLSGYAVPDRLPNLPAYLRTKYSLPDAAIDEMEEYFDRLRQQYGFKGDGV